MANYCPQRSNAPGTEQARRLSYVMSNNIWEKAEFALTRYVRERYLFITAGGVAGKENKLLEGYATDRKTVPDIVAECHEGDVEIVGRPTGNWICKCTITITTKNPDETGQTNSARFGLVLDSLLDDQAAEGLSSNAENFTVFWCQVTGFRKHIQGDRLVCEVNLTLHCCASVIT